MTRRGFYLLGRVRGAPVRLHWSTLLVAVFIGITSGAGLSLFTLIASVMTLGLILIHELGHAAMVWRYRHHVVGIEVWGFHGVCYWEGHASRYEDAAISAPRAQSGRGRVYLLYGGPGGWPSGESLAALPSVTGAQPGDAAGTAVAAPGDLDGDGRGELLISSPGWDVEDPDSGAVLESQRGRIYAISGQP